MKTIEFEILRPADQEALALIANWYFAEWQIPVDNMLERLRTITADKEQFQVLIKLDGKPVSTAGIYNYVSLLDKEPKFKVFKKWLALVYTVPAERGNGYGAAVCNYILEHSKILGFKEIHLFTDTAESLYRRLGWKEIERLTVNNRDIVVMSKTVL